MTTRLLLYLHWKISRFLWICRYRFHSHSQCQPQMANTPRAPDTNYSYQSISITLWNMEIINLLDSSTFWPFLWPFFSSSHLFLESRLYGSMWLCLSKLCLHSLSLQLNCHLILVMFLITANILSCNFCPTCSILENLGITNRSTVLFTILLAMEFF